MVLGCEHSMDPLRPADLIGLDTMKPIADSTYEDFLVDSGLYDKKSGRGLVVLAEAVVTASTSCPTAAGRLVHLPGRLTPDQTMWKKPCRRA